MTNEGQLFVFEGADGAGKTSISEKFACSIREKGVNAYLLAFPGKKPNTLGDLVYRLHHESRSLGVNSLTPSSLQALHIAAHLDAIETSIIPALEAGDCIVLDRYWWSTWVYGLVGSMRREILDALIEVERRAWGKWQPTALFYITRTEPLRSEPTENWRHLKVVYEQLISLEKGKYPIVVVKNETTEDAALQQMFSQIDF